MTQEQKPSRPTPLVDGFIKSAAEGMARQEWVGWDEIKVTDADIEQVKRELAEAAETEKGVK